MDQPPWLPPAWADLGQTEVSGGKSNPRIVAYYRDAGHTGISDDGVAWCAAFVGACLERSGVQSTRSLMARSYLSWGQKLDAPRCGAIAVLSRGAPPYGHVAFVVGWSESEVYLLGGNQGDMVSVAAFDRSRVIGLRWIDRDDPQKRKPAAQSELTRNGASDRFDAALIHVLEMEGGYTDDPHDPGGPTNFGITLADYARAVGEPLTAASRLRLRDELKRIPHDLVRKIYRTRYWDASHADRFAPGLALMHFDAAVNHGLTGAAELLQGALGVDVDGEIGPITLAAAEAGEPSSVLDRYAAARRTRYRGLPHFWRFGRGWLRRVDLTLDRARTIQAGAAAPIDDAASPAPPDALSNPKEPVAMSADQLSSKTSSMPTPSTTVGGGKWWGRSMTVWGAMVTALSAVVPVLAPAIGVEISPETVRTLGDQTLQLIQVAGGLVGTVLTIYGRVRAVERLERRSFTLHL